MNKFALRTGTVAAILLLAAACSNQSGNSGGIKYGLPTVDYRSQTDWQRNNVKGKPRLVERWLALVNDESTLQLTDSALIERTVFNEQGWMVRAEQYSTEGQLQIVIERTFDSSGLVVSALAQMPNSGEMQKTTYSYDSKQRMIAYQVEDRNGPGSGAHLTFIYDDQGRCTEELIKDGSDQLRSRMVRTFGPDGRPIDEIFYDPSNNVVRKTQYDGPHRVVFNMFDSTQTMVYNRDSKFTPEQSESLIVSGYSANGYSTIRKQIGPQGFETRRIVVQPSGVDTARYDLEYTTDSKGNWLRKTIRLLTQNPDPNVPRVSVELQHTSYFE